MGFFSNLLRGLSDSGEFSHYREELASVGGSRTAVRLVEAVPTLGFVSLVYHWDQRLSHGDADRLDSRLRAYVVCAIGQAARKAGLSVEPGPPHGCRPSWIIASPDSGRHVIYGLGPCSFDVGQQVCELAVGPVVSPPVALPGGRDSVTTHLAESFKALFSELTV